MASLAKKGYEPASHDRLKRVPKGFDPEHPRADLLKRKGLVVSFPKMPKGLIATKKLVPWLVTACKTVSPLVEWLAYATA